jgi:hypothetical protein
MDTYNSILAQLKVQETLWAAYFPPTKNYYIGQEHDENTAYLFTEQVFFSDFQKYMKQQQISVEAVENRLSNRPFLMGDLYRSGVTMLVIDNGQSHLGIGLSELMEIPDYSQMPPEQRPVLNPALLCRMNILFQQIQSGTASGITEMNIWHELYHATLLMPAAGTDGALTVPVHKTSEGKQLFMFFTDMEEMRRYGFGQQFTARRADFEVMNQLCQRGDGVVINPCGINMVLDAQLLQAAEATAVGTLASNAARTMQASNRITVTDPEVWPVEMTEKITALLEKDQNAGAAYLRMMVKPGSVRPDYLLLLDYSGEKMNDLEQKIAQEAMPLAGGWNLEIVSLHEAAVRAWIGNAEPFYKKPLKRRR